ncbi:MAG: M20/M25/M40 family metallo-hydrolase [Kordiimonadaceae bacterium]|nr:M20/M25/M40 family metallo-hydrolase [Kordiimonadaceae bacterium]MBO6569690.1 M20/M25/M40 family metallo-hydrolase [Kordiimonadaceae bacterium]MBO6966225.1 M20/M25/M40 family metallo-hydrolase [Kordiimonadaceae bacterium]
MKSKLMSLLAALSLSTLAVPAIAEDAHPNMPFGAKALDIYRTVIEFKSTAEHGETPAMARYLADQFRDGGFADDDIFLFEIGNAAGLIVRYHGDGTSGKAPVSISAHMDVVEANPADWVRDPFKLTEEDGYFFARGAADDKLGVVATTVAFLRLKAEGWVPNRDLIIAFSGDEETGMLTTRALVQDHLALTNSEFVLNADSGGATLPDGGGRPVSFAMQAAEKTYATWQLTITNPGGHSSRPRNDNAIYELADALIKIREFKFPVRANELTRRYFKFTGERTPGPKGEAMQAFAADPTDADAVQVLRADPGIVGTTGTTCVATMLAGGHAENALPQSATATVNCRIFPGEGVAATEATLRDVVGNDAVEFNMISNPTETDPSPLREDVLAALQKAVDNKFPGLEIVPYMSSGGTDGMHFRAAGIPSYGVNGGYSKAGDTFAHGLNERILQQSFYDNLAHWYVLLKAIAGDS